MSQRRVNLFEGRVFEKSDHATFSRESIITHSMAPEYKVTNFYHNAECGNYLSPQRDPGQVQIHGQAPEYSQSVLQNQSRPPELFSRSLSLLSFPHPQA
jgi:hypothetical protein